ncbi:MAG: hypothetical protein DRJ32_04970 [Thermoprotei archaeon]|nr:MAG: hypothetical protein DRJ32_04970 [Thermoprotei archaeon]
MKLSMKRPEIYLKIREVIEDLNYSAGSVIVEGRHDELVLRSYGYSGKIFRFSDSRMNILEFTEMVAEKCIEPVAILTDFDEEGDRIYKRIKSELQALGIKILDSPRNELYKIASSHGVHTIEGLAHFKPSLFQTSNKPKK